MSNTVKQTLWMLPSDLADAASRYARTLPADERGTFVDSMMRTSFALDVCKSDEEIEAYYAKADQESTRPLGVSGSDADKVGHTFITCGIDERITADTLSDETADNDNVVPGESCQVSVAQLRNACERADASGRSSFVETLDAIGSVEWNADKAQPNLSQLARRLNRSIPAVRERWTHLQAFITSDRFGQLSAE